MALSEININLINQPSIIYWGSIIYGNPNMILSFFPREKYGPHGPHPGSHRVPIQGPIAWEICTRASQLRPSKSQVPIPYQEPKLTRLPVSELLEVTKIFLVISWVNGWEISWDLTMNNCDLIFWIFFGYHGIMWCKKIHKGQLRLFLWVEPLSIIY